MAFWGSLITKRSSFGPRFRFGIFFVIKWYYHPDPLVGRCPSPGSDRDAGNPHASASRVCLPVPALGHSMVAVAGFRYPRFRF